ncbi:hypothetical protein ACRYCC_39305 [Actinomadura scrupuli]|uniref:hypothetical protein n=1 Tax=Actinomadura scrupuli TaxID=559629 RepID=UPI003D98A7BD
MARHRTDPGGGGRVAMTVAASAAVIALAGVGGSALFLALTAETPSPSALPASATSTASPARTLTVTVTGPECHVFVSVPAGEVLLDRTLRRGESVRFDDPRLALVLSDGGAAQVYLNGVLQAPGAAGARQEFSVSRAASS